MWYIHTRQVHPISMRCLLRAAQTLPVLQRAVQHLQCTSTSRGAYECGLYELPSTGQHHMTSQPFTGMRYVPPPLHRYKPAPQCTVACAPQPPAAQPPAAQQDPKPRKRRRLDDVCVDLRPDLSKNVLQSFIVQGKVHVDGVPQTKAGYQVCVVGVEVDTPCVIPTQHISFPHNIFHSHTTYFIPHTSCFIPHISCIIPTQHAPFLYPPPPLTPPPHPPTHPPTPTHRSPPKQWSRCLQSCPSMSAGQA